MTPLVEIAVEPKSTADQERLEAALARLVSEDPSFTASTDHESGQTILKGMGELHLARKIDQLTGAYGVDANIGAPQVAYREALGRKAEIDYTYKRQTGGTGQFARIKLVFEPGEPGSGFVFESAIVGGNVPKEHIPGVQKGLESSKENGLLAGFPLIDFKATLIDGAYHDVDSSPAAFEIAARAAFKELREKGEPLLLEPVMAVEVSADDGDVPAIVADLRGRRARRLEHRPEGDGRLITALVPLANLFGYANSLRAMTSDRAQFKDAFDHYAPVDTQPDAPGPFAPAAAMRA